MPSLSLSYIAAAIICILVSMVLHEFMHGYTAYLLGDTTAFEEGRLSLNPLHHIDPFMTVILPIISLLTFGIPVMAAKPVPFNPYRVKFAEFGAALIAAAGPLTNLVLAVAAALLAKALGLELGPDTFLSVFIIINIALFVFNLVPIPPLDGSRIVFALAPEAVQRLMSDIEPFGLFIVLALVLVGGFGGFLSNIDQSILNHLL